MNGVHPAESEMLRPVLKLFPMSIYYRLAEVPLGRRRIDLLCIGKERKSASVSVELKIDKWRTALWQAIVNFQLSEQSYIAIWHTYIDRALKNAELITQYGVGLIEVTSKTSRVLIPSQDLRKRVSRYPSRETLKANPHLQT